MAEVNRVGLFLAASVTGNGCSNILCTCGASCGCSHTGDGEARSDAPLNGAGIPLIAPNLVTATSGEEVSTCCSGNTSTTFGSETSDSRFESANKAQICSCGHHDPSDTSGTLKPLDKVTLAVGILLSKPALRPQSLPLHQLSTHPAFPDEVFHPPAV